MKKFTFKKHIPTGHYRSFEAESHDIKLNGKVVGSISEIRTIGPTKRPNEGRFNIGFRVIKKDIMEDKNPNCVWKWISLKYKPSSAQEAKDFIAKRSEDIQKQFNLYIDKD